MLLRCLRGACPLGVHFARYILTPTSLRHASVEARTRGSVAMLSWRSATKDPSFLYAICVGAVVCWLIILRLCVALGAELRAFYVKTVRSHAFYPLLITRRSGTTNVTLLHFLLVAIHLIANIVVLVIRVHGPIELARRSALMFTINLILLGAGSRTSFVAERVFDMEKADYDFLHRWVGRVAAVEGAIHGLAYLTTDASSTRVGIPVRLRVLLHPVRVLIKTRYM